MKSPIPYSILVDSVLIFKPLFEHIHVPIVLTSMKLRTLLTWTASPKRHLPAELIHIPHVVARTEKGSKAFLSLIWQSSNRIANRIGMEFFMWRQGRGELELLRVAGCFIGLIVFRSVSLSVCIETSEWLSSSSNDGSGALESDDGHGIFIIIIVLCDYCAETSLHH